MSNEEMCESMDRKIAEVARERRTVTYGQTSRGFEVTFEGRTVIMGRPTNIAELRESIIDRTARLEEHASRLRMLTALADAIEADEGKAKTLASEQRNRKASATRAHNRDPFGFGATA